MSDESPFTAVLAFANDERGAVTIEFVTIFPAFVFSMLLAVDASILYLTHTDLFTTSRDVARRVSVGALHVDDVPAYVSDRAMLGARTYTVGTLSGSVVVVELSVNVGDASVFGFFTPILDRQMSVRVEMLREPTPEPLISGSTV
jgi:Flp pilus assembly protein TadG